MTVCRDGHGTIVLDGICNVEDADALLQLLVATPATPVDWTRADRLHTAVMQVILACNPTLLGDCGDLWMRQWLAPEKVP